MYKKLIYILLLFLVSITLTACNKPKAIILFNKNPITKDNLFDNSTVFPAGKRIYYVFMTEKPIESDFIRIRVIKRSGDGFTVPAKLVYSDDFKLKKEQVYYYTNYIVLHEKGDFFMCVYELNDLRKPLATTNFRVTN